MLDSGVTPGAPASASADDRGHRLAREALAKGPARLSPLEVLRLYPAHDYTLEGALLSRASSHRDRPFLLDPEGKATSWSDFHARSLRLAAALAARGVRSGDRVAIMARNDPAHVLLLFALARLGAIFVPVNSEYGVQEAGHILRHTEVSGILASPQTIDVVRQAAQGLPSAPWLCVTGEHPVPDATRFDALVEDGRDQPVPANAADPDAVALIIHTSGSTGLPKGAMHSQRSLLLAGEAYVVRVQLQPRDRLMMILPMFHMNALFYTLGGTLATGAAVIVMERFSASTFWISAERTGATVVNMMDTTVNILKSRPRSEYREGHRLRVIGGGTRPSSEHFLRQECGIPHLFAGYGMTEIPGVTGVLLDGPNVGTSMGTLGRHPDPARPWAECRIVDDAGRDVPDDTPGELLVRTPILTKGYWRNPQGTAEAVRDGWFHTGDLVRRNAQGVFFFVARKREIIRRRGENISPVEIEKVALAHPAVLEAAVVPLPGELGDEEILLVASIRDGASADARELADWCASQLSPVKVPRFVVFVDEMPRTGPTKIAKDALRKDRQLHARATDLGPASASRR